MSQSDDLIVQPQKNVCLPEKALSFIVYTNIVLLHTKLITTMLL